MYTHGTGLTHLCHFNTSTQANGVGRGDINRPAGVSDAVLGEVTAKWEALSKQRKKRPLPEVVGNLMEGLLSWVGFSFGCCLGWG